MFDPCFGSRIELNLGRVVIHNCYSCKWAYRDEDEDNEICSLNPEPVKCYKRKYKPCRFYEMDEEAKKI